MSTTLAVMNIKHNNNDDYHSDQFWNQNKISKNDLVICNIECVMMMTMIWILALRGEGTQTRGYCLYSKYYINQYNQNLISPK